MIYLKNRETDRTIEMPDDAEIPEGWEKIEVLLCTWCKSKPVNDACNDWFLTLVYGYRYCSEYCKLEHCKSQINQAV